MAIQPCNAKRVILLVSPSQLDAVWHRARHDETITFRCLAAIAGQKLEEEPYHAWLIHTGETAQTAQFLRQYFSSTFAFGNLPQVSGIENAREIFESVLIVASDPLNIDHTLICDCTGGAKPMSVAMALACNFHALTSESRTRLILTYIPRDRNNDEILFHEFDLSRVVAEEQRKYVDQQESLGRLRYLSRYAPILAHEIKNPLNLIGTALHLLRSASWNPNDKTQLDKIEKAVQEIDTVVSGIRETMHKETNRLSSSPIRLSEVMQRLKGRTEKLHPSLTLRVEGDISGIQPRMTEEKLYSVFTNLIDNAAHATAGQGTVSFNFKRDDSHLRISVEDDGPGIPADLQADLFKPLPRGRSSSGTGMGLSIVRTFVIEEGGSIALDGTFQHGARFLIDLPIEKNGEAQP